MAKKILVVDDEPDLLKVVTFRLKRAGFEVLQAIDGRQAMDLIQTTEGLALVLLDLNMPAPGGWEVCKRIKENDALKHIGVIFLSASSTAINPQTVKAAGAQDYLLKPFEPQALLEKIKKYL